jgi:predicted DNA-binding transcriptional regulator YafY
VLEGSYGIFTGTAQAWAVLRFSAEAARWAAEERWHADQLGAWKPSGYELQVPYSNPTELIMEILRYGPEVEVLAPTELRETVLGRLREAVGKYC